MIVYDCKPDRYVYIYTCILYIYHDSYSDPVGLTSSDGLSHDQSVSTGKSSPVD